MCLYKPTEHINYVAKCEYCDIESVPLSNNHHVAIYKLMDKYNWIVYNDLKSTFCCEKCLDNHEILHIEDILNEE